MTNMLDHATQNVVRLASYIDLIQEKQSILSRIQNSRFHMNVLLLKTTQNITHTLMIHFVFTQKIKR